MLFRSRTERRSKNYGPGQSPLCTNVTGRFSADNRERLRSSWFVWVREIPCNFVDRVLRILDHTNPQITLSYTKEHELRVFARSGLANTGRRLALSWQARLRHAR